MTDPMCSHMIAGGAGGFIATVLQSGYIELPRIRDHKLYLGGLGGLLIGIGAGLYGNQSVENAFFWGLGGSTILKSLISKIPADIGPRLMDAGKKGGQFMATIIVFLKGVKWV